MSLLRQGGVFMVPLLLASVVAVAIMFERLYWFARLQPGNDAFRKRLKEAVAGGDLAEAKRSAG